MSEDYFVTCCDQIKEWVEDFFLGKMEEKNAVDMPHLSSYLGDKDEGVKKFVEEVHYNLQRGNDGEMIKKMTKLFFKVGVEKRELLLVYDILPHSRDFLGALEEEFKRYCEIKSDCIKIEECMNKIASTLIENPLDFDVSSVCREGDYLRSVENFRKANTVWDVLRQKKIADYVPCGYRGGIYFIWYLKFNSFHCLSLLNQICNPYLYNHVLNNRDCDPATLGLLDWIEGDRIFEASGEFSSASGKIALWLIDFWLDRSALYCNRKEELNEDVKKYIQFLFDRICKRRDSQLLRLWLLISYVRWGVEYPTENTKFYGFFLELLKESFRNASLEKLKKDLNLTSPSKTKIRKCIETGLGYGGDGVANMSNLIALCSLELKELQNNDVDIVYLLEVVMYSLPDDICFLKRRVVKELQLHSEEYILGKLIVRCENPSDAWMRLWDGFSSARFRLRQGAIDVEGSLSDSVEYLPAIGISIFDWLVTLQPGDNDSILRLWKNVWEAVYSEWVVNFVQRSSLESYMIMLLLRYVDYKLKHRNNNFPSVHFFISQLSNSSEFVARVLTTLRMHFKEKELIAIYSNFEKIIQSYVKIEDNLRERVCRDVDLVLLKNSKAILDCLNCNK